MKKLLLFSALAFGLVSHGQRTCGTPQKIQELIAQDPSFEQHYNNTRQLLQDNAQNQAFSTNSTAQPTVVVTVPVVVHVLYKNAQQNISDAQIASQIAVLNADYRKLNADFTSVVPAVWQSLAADMEINFVMATTTPTGNPTTGITRKSVPSSFVFDDQYYQSAGQPAWNTLEYLNIWVGNFSQPGLLGFAYPPAAAGAPFDGLCIDYNNFGTMGTVMVGFDKGRTATHEIGHYFGLEHPWGDDFSACGTGANSDGVADTPATNNPYYGCPNFPNNTNACTATTNGSMFMNFMDYTDDACMAFFTNGQKGIVTAAINGPRNSVLSNLDFAAVSSVKVFPNPANNEFSVISGTQELTKVELFNIAGQLVKTEALSGLEAKVNISSFESGLYFARFYSGSKLLKSEKIIKE